MHSLKKLLFQQYQVVLKNSPTNDLLSNVPLEYYSQIEVHKNAISINEQKIANNLFYFTINKFKAHQNSTNNADKLYYLLHRDFN